MVADIALHASGHEGDDRNYHAHILLTAREIGPEGFTTKNRDWNAKELLEDWRETWARDTNHALERCGAETVRAVSLDRQPLPQLSAGAWQLKERGCPGLAGDQGTGRRGGPRSAGAGREGAHLVEACRGMGGGTGA